MWCSQHFAWCGRHGAWHFAFLTPIFTVLQLATLWLTTICLTPLQLTTLQLPKTTAYDFMTFVLRPVENVSVSPIFFLNSIKGWTLFIIWWTLSIILCTPIHYMMDPCPSYDGPQTVPNQKVMNNSAIQWRIKKIISQHSLNSNSLIHRLLKTRDIANLSKKGIHHIMYPIHHMMYPYPAYDVPLSIIWCTPIHHMLHPVHHMMEELKNIYCDSIKFWVISY